MFIQQDTSFVKPGSPGPLSATADDSLSAVQPVFRFIDSAITNTHNTRATAPAPSYINFYSGHELPVIHQNAISFRDSTPDWLFFILLIVVASLAWIRYFYGKIFHQTLQAIFNMNITNQIVRDENVLLQRTSAFLGIVFNIVFAVILYHISVHYQWNIFNIDNSFGRFLFLMLAVSAVYSFKFLLLKILGFIFSVEKEMATYIFNIFLINNMLGLLLIPIAILLSFSVTQHTGIYIIAACILYGLSLNYRVIRGILIGLSYKGVNLMYLFLYFCALEFAPVLVLLKIVTHGR